MKKVSKIKKSKKAKVSLIVKDNNQKRLAVCENSVMMLYCFMMVVIMQ